MKYLFGYGENLEKLFYVIRIMTLFKNLNTQESDTQEFEDDIPFEISNEHPLAPKLLCWETPQIGI